VLIVNDGSIDGSGRIADNLAAEFPIVRMIHHPRNFGVGSACARASPTRAATTSWCWRGSELRAAHIERMLDRMIETSAKLVVASPNGPGGTVANVPRWRLFLSRSPIGSCPFSRRQLLDLDLHGAAFDRRFLRGARVNLMPEIMHKVLVQQGLAILLFALYCGTRMFIHYFEAYGELLRTQASVDPRAAAHRYQAHRTPTFSRCCRSFSPFSSSASACSPTRPSTTTTTIPPQLVHVPLDGGVA